MSENGTMKGARGGSGRPYAGCPGDAGGFPRNTHKSGFLIFRGGLYGILGFNDEFFSAIYELFKK